MASTQTNILTKCLKAEGKTLNLQTKNHIKQNLINSKTNYDDEFIKLGKINTIFFDLDNTLIPTRSADLKTCRRLSEILQDQYGFTIDEALYATQNFLKTFRQCPDNSQYTLDTWRTNLWRDALPPKYKQLADTIYPIWLEMRFHYLTMPLEYVTLLKRLRDIGGYHLALITNGPSNAQWEKVIRLQVQQYFDYLLVSGDLPWEKPNPNIFYDACNYLQVQPKQCCMIGDKLESDIKGGYLAKLGATFWLPLSAQEIEELHNDCELEYKPSFVLRNLTELYEYFNLNVTNLQQQVPAYNKISQSNKYRHRTGGPSSSPCVDYINSETDNSSDSIN